jgi:hypothetical protein
MNRHRLMNMPIQEFLIAFGLRDFVYLFSPVGTLRMLAIDGICLMVKRFAFLLSDRIFIFFPIAFITMRAHG